MMEEMSRDKQENWLRTSCVDGIVWHESVCVYVCVRERKCMHVCMVASRNKQESVEEDQLVLCSMSQCVCV